MRYAHIDDAEFDDDIDPEIIAAESDIDRLTSWLKTLQDRDETISLQVGAAREAGIADNVWLERACRALGWTRKGVRCVSRRLRELNHEPESMDPYIGRLRRRITDLERLLEKAQSKQPMDESEAVAHWKGVAERHAERVEKLKAHIASVTVTNAAAKQERLAGRDRMFREVAKELLAPQDFFRVVGEVEARMAAKVEAA